MAPLDEYISKRIDKIEEESNTSKEIQQKVELAPIFKKHAENYAKSCQRKEKQEKCQQEKKKKGNGFNSEWDLVVLMIILGLGNNGYPP